MAEYINKQEILNKFKKFPTDKGTFALANWFYQTVKNTPAADVRITAHASWEEISPATGVYQCSRCRSVRSFPCGTPGENHADYCSVCGARMSSKVDEEKAQHRNEHRKIVNEAPTADVEPAALVWTG